MLYVKSAPRYQKKIKATTLQHPQNLSLNKYLQNSELRAVSISSELCRVVLHSPWGWGHGSAVVGTRGDASAPPCAQVLSTERSWCPELWLTVLVCEMVCVLSWDMCRTGLRKYRHFGSIRMEFRLNFWRSTASTLWGFFCIFFFSETDKLMRIF